MGGKENTFKGLTITLKKRKLSINKGDLSHLSDALDEQYLVWGHFDEMTLKYIDTWLKWAPYHTETISLKDEYVDKYNIKAYFPEFAKRNAYQSQGFDYEVWNPHNKDYPFVVTSVINISDEYARNIMKNEERICNAFSRLILECVEEGNLENRWSDMHCAFFPTIGFSDFVLMFKTAELNAVLDIIEILKQKKVGKIPCLSNAYTMIGFRNRGMEKLTEEAVGGIKLAIRFGLKDGVSCKYFNAYFESLMKDKVEKNYGVLGDADFMIVSNMELKQALPLYFDDEEPGVFHPSHDIFKYYIRSMQSEIRAHVPSGYLDDDALYKGREDKNIEEYREEFLKLVDELSYFMLENRIPGRIVYSLQIIMKRFLQLIQSRHCFDMESIVGRAFRNFEKCIEQNIGEINILDDDEKHSNIQEMLEAMNMFREKIGDYLADMQRSDSLFLEGRSLSHPSIGSATKLLFFYNGFIDRVKEYLCPLETDKYSFVVTSGGTDQTQAIDLFSHLDPTVENTHFVILMTVPESSLYDVKSSLFNVLHETLHFCGEREREKRFQFVVKAVCEYTAVAFGDFFERNQIMFFNCILSGLKPYMNLKTREVLARELSTVFSIKTNGLKEKLQRLIQKRIYECLKNKSDNYAFYYGRNVYANLYEILEKEIFYPEVKKERLEYDIYAYFVDYRSELVEEIHCLLRKYNILYSNVKLIVREAKEDGTKIQKERGFNVDLDMGMVRSVINLYFGRDVRNAGSGIFIDEEDENINLSDLLEVLRYLFKECYADCMSGKILSAPEEQFIFSFLTEARNERDAFPTGTLNSLRMIIDFKYLYAIENSIPECVRQRLDLYAKKSAMQREGYIEINKTVDWMQKIINIKGKEERIFALVNPVLEYLEECRVKWDEIGVMENLQELKRLNTYSNMETPENIYDFLHYTADNWTAYAKES
ncbi:hypothetical protein [Hominisplanchenecus murintestinalis]|uniref:hypothetical protein n=1 Tax=Hominisplanchenecus murintestinalis TaxID=2941517 RepID=UPI00203D768C|nr:hypothetical protein [Hominisplanchenecus murintestinalis]